MTHIMTFTKRARRTAHTAATLALAALAAVMATACSSELDQALTQQRQDGSTRIAAPTLAAFPATAATVEVTPGMASRAASRAVPGAGATQKSAWEVGDEVLMRYRFNTYEKKDEPSCYTEIFVTYKVVGIGENGIPTLAVKEDAQVLKYKMKVTDSGREFSENTLTTLPKADIENGVPTPTTVVNDKYQPYVYYAPGQTWKLMSVTTNSDNTETRTPADAITETGYYTIFPCHINKTDDGKYCMATNDNWASDIAISPTSTFTMSFTGSRLRIHALPGDDVTLSGDFIPVESNKLKEGESITVKADDDGNAYFYGTWEENAKLTVELKSSLTNNENVPVFKATIADVSEKGKTYAIDATAGYTDVLCCSAAELLTTDASGNTILSTAASNHTTWIVTDAGTLAANNAIKTALGLAYTADNDTRIDLTLPNVTEIADNALRFCYALRSVNLPAATTIKSGTFGRCDALTTVEAPAAITIGDYAFEECTALTTVSLPTATTIGRAPFLNCTANQITLTLNKDYSGDGFSWDNLNLNYSSCTLKAIIKSE